MEPEEVKVDEVKKTEYRFYDKAAIDKLETERDKLKQGIKDFLAGDYPNPRSYAKGDTRTSCPHGQYRWESCSECDEAFLESLIKEEST